MLQSFNIFMLQQRIVIIEMCCKIIVLQNYSVAMLQKNKYVFNFYLFILTRP